MATLIKENKWIQLVERWESESIQNGLADMINRNNDYQPHVEELLRVILGFVSTLYSNAYSLDNATRMLYQKRQKQLRGFNLCTPNNLQSENKLFYKILKTMPRGFAKYMLRGGSFYVSDDESLTPYKANQFLDYLNSDKFSNNNAF